ncbi:MAG: hypothetical protein NTX61_08310 [Bacteroidetes bacterium]|nr:hypothetical protein [Bacteroidota bacterium]
MDADDFKPYINESVTLIMADGSKEEVGIENISKESNTVTYTTKHGLGERSMGKEVVKTINAFLVSKIESQIGKKIHP